MNKPENPGWEQFEAIFQRESSKAGKEQYLVPYFIAGHPGSTMDDAKELGTYLRNAQHQGATGAGIHPDSHDRVMRHVLHR
jgi:radical SAM superfamily enzyme YgiQ (UPF0313 family)